MSRVESGIREESRRKSTNGRLGEEEKEERRERIEENEIMK